MTAPHRPRVFVSYAHEDEAHKDKLVRQFSDMVRRGEIELWQDRVIRPGADWRGDIRAAVEQCDMALLLVSDAFIASEFIDSEELGLLLQRREREGVTVVPLIVRPCRWKTSRVQALQVLPRDGRAITTFPTENGERDQAWVDVADALTLSVRELTARLGRGADPAPVQHPTAEPPSHRAAALQPSAQLQPSTAPVAILPPPVLVPPTAQGDALDRHLGEILRSLARGSLVLFLGDELNLAGAAAALPWAPGARHRMPSSSELAHHLARTYAYPLSTGQDLTQVAQFVALRDGPGPLKGELHDAYAAEVALDDTYRALAALPERARGHGWPSPIFVTVNLDGLLETALQQAGEAFDTLVYTTDGDGAGRFVHLASDGRRSVIDRPNEFTGLSTDGRAVIVRLRGRVEPLDPRNDSVVVTEDEHIGHVAGRDLTALLPSTLVRRLLRSNFLFLGHSLAEWSTRVFVHRLCGGERVRSRSWAVRERFDDFDREVWRARDVAVVQQPILSCLQRLAGAAGAADADTPAWVRP